MGGSVRAVRDIDVVVRAGCAVARVVVRDRLVRDAVEVVRGDVRAVVGLCDVACVAVVGVVRGDEVRFVAVVRGERAVARDVVRNRVVRDARVVVRDRLARDVVMVACDAAGEVVRAVVRVVVGGGSRVVRVVVASAARASWAAREARASRASAATPAADGAEVLGRPSSAALIPTWVSHSCAVGGPPWVPER